MFKRPEQSGRELVSEFEYEFEYACKRIVRVRNVALVCFLVFSSFLLMVQAIYVEAFVVATRDCRAQFCWLIFLRSHSRLRAFRTRIYGAIRPSFRRDIFAHLHYHTIVNRQKM